MNAAQEALNRLVQRARFDSMFAGTFTLNPEAALNEILAFYQLDLPDAERDTVISAAQSKLGVDSEANRMVQQAREEHAQTLRLSSGTAPSELFPSARQPTHSTAFPQHVSVEEQPDGSTLFIPEPHPAGVDPWVPQQE